MKFFSQLTIKTENYTGKHWVGFIPDSKYIYLIDFKVKVLFPVETPVIEI